MALKVFNKEIPRERISTSMILLLRLSFHVVSCDQKLDIGKRSILMAMEYIEGQSMREIINEGQRPDIDTFDCLALPNGSSESS